MVLARHVTSYFFAAAVAVADPSPPATGSPPPPPPGADEPGPGPAAHSSVDRLILRAQARQLAGDLDGALALLTDALELAATTEVPPRTEADILLGLADVHERLAETAPAAHVRIASDLRARLLRDRERLDLTEDEIAALRQRQTPPKPPSDSRASAPNTAVAEKVLEAKVLTTRKMISAGTTMFTVGMGFTLGGIVLLAYADATERNLDEYKIPDQEDERHDAIRDGAAQNGGGIALLSMGGVLVVVGVVLLAVGVSRTRAQLGKKRVAIHAPLGALGMKF